MSRWVAMATMPQIEWTSPVAAAGIPIPLNRIKNDHVGGFDCDVGSTAERDADLGLHQSRRIINLVADHGHAGILLELPTISAFSAGNTRAWTSSMPTAAAK